MTQILQSYFLKKKFILRIFSKTVNNIQNTNIPHDKQQKNYLNPKPKPQTNKDESFANHLLNSQMDSSTPLRPNGTQNQFYYLIAKLLFRTVKDMQ